MPLSGKAVVKLLIKRGFRVESQRGSHVKLIKKGCVTVVPVHSNRDLGKGLICQIEKQSGEKLR